MGNGDRSKQNQYFIPPQKKKNIDDKLGLVSIFFEKPFSRSVTPAPTNF